MGDERLRCVVTIVHQQTACRHNGARKARNRGRRNRVSFDSGRSRSKVPRGAVYFSSQKALTFGPTDCAIGNGPLLCLASAATGTRKVSLQPIVLTISNTGNYLVQGSSNFCAHLDACPTYKYYLVFGKPFAKRPVSLSAPIPCK